MLVDPVGQKSRPMARSTIKVGSELLFGGIGGTIIELPSRQDYSLESRFSPTFPCVAGNVALL